MFHNFNCLLKSSLSNFSKVISFLAFYLKSIHRLPALGVIVLLVGSQLSFTTLNLLTPYIQQKSAMSSLMKMLQLDKIKAEATGSTAISSSSASSTNSGSSVTVSGSSSKVSSSSKASTSSAMSVAGTTSTNPSSISVLKIYILTVVQ
jgi:hypothetical protein